MQSFKFSLITLLSLSSLFANAQTKNDSIKVWGNCGMCETRIEKAAKHAGALSADWNAETQMLTVSYDETNASLSTIESKIASAGHDTKNKTASKEAYNKLHGCCQYDRKETISSSASCCIAGASCCSSSQACCTKTMSTAKANTGDCCISGASCCSVGQNCCSTTRASNAVIKECAAAASCCVAGASCCNKTAKVVSFATVDCCTTGANCCTTSQSCCAKNAA